MILDLVWIRDGNILFTEGEAVVVNLKSNEIVIGEISSLGENYIVIKSSFLGSVEIDKFDIENIEHK